jgi:hypothetical protein
VRTLCGLLIAALASGCDIDQLPWEEGPPALPPPPGPHTTASAAERAPGAIPSQLRDLLPDAAAVPEAGAGPHAAAANSALTELRARRLRLPPRRATAQLVAFGKGRVARLVEDAMVVLKTKDFTPESVISIADPRRVLALQDGSLLVAGREQLLRLPPGRRQPQAYRRIPILAESLVFRDRRHDHRFWLLHGIDPTLYQYELRPDDAILLGLKHFIKLEDFDRDGFVALKDGSFLYTAGEQVRRFFPHGKLLRLDTPLRACAVWRILTTYRIDRMWIVCDDGQLHLVQLGPRLQVVRSHQLPSGPYDLAANDSHIADVRAVQPAGEPRKWWLTVVDRHGRELVNHALPNPSAPLAADWVQQETRNRSVALSRRPPLVAVGGPTWLSVWNIKTGQQVYAREGVEDPPQSRSKQ